MVTIGNMDLTQWNARTIACVIGGACALMAILISLILIYKHLRNYTRPKLQRSIARILLMIPIYSLCSWLSLIFIEQAPIIDVFRDCYEAVLLHQFFSLLISFINEYEGEESDQDEEGQEKNAAQQDQVGEDLKELVPLKLPPGTKLVGGHVVWVDEERVIHVLKTKPPMSVWDGFYPIPCCCCNCCKCCFFSPGRKFLSWTRRSIMQFVIIKPIIAFAALVMSLCGVYNNGSMSPAGGYLWVIIIENVSIMIALFALVLFYHAVAKELAPFRPVPKFLCIKAIVAFAFWQSILIAILVYFKVLQGNDTFSTEELSEFLQDWAICIEMVFISIAHIFVFGHKSYRDPAQENLISAPLKTMKPFISNLLDVILLRDVFVEAVTIFNPLPKDKRQRRKERQKMLAQQGDLTEPLLE